MTAAAQLVPDKAYPPAITAMAILVCCMLGYAFSLLDRQILALMVDMVKADLLLTDVQIGLCQGLAFAIFYSVLGLPCGVLADRTLRTRLIAVGITFWSLATAACGLATGFWSLFLARMCVGLGEAVLVPSAYSLLSDSFPRHRLVTALAIFGFSGLAGAGFAMLIGGLVLEAITNARTLPFGLTGVAPWRIVFGLVGLPGVVVGVLFLLLPEPSRKNVLRAENGAIVHLDLKDARNYLWHRRRIYLPLYAAPVLLGTVVYGAISWFPAFLSRNFELRMGQVGTIAGVIQVGGALSGALLGPAIVRYMARRGHRDAHLRALLVVGGLTLVPATVAPLLPDFGAMIVLWCFAQVMLGSYLGVSMAGLQLRTPNQLRALNSAICMCLAALIGAGLGAPAVSAVAQYVFHDEQALGFGLSAVAAVCVPTAMFLMAWGLKAHRDDEFDHQPSSADSVTALESGE